ncbi:hypothetical protein K474DRAFT_1702854 [Panus rudis PR-1116 ss-1]|nr:hypothetical protein K474DRAFT_1702854 [Panus rudis PR-1116 ss-1]
MSYVVFAFGRSFLYFSSRNDVYGVTDPQQYKYAPNQPFNDPAIMSAQLATAPSMTMSHQQLRDNGNVGFMNGPPPGMEQLAYGPPPGLGLGPSFPPGLVPNGPAALLQTQNQLAAMAARGGLDNGSAHVSGATSPVPSPALSSSDFPALQETTGSQSTHEKRQPSAEENSTNPTDNTIPEAESTPSQLSAADSEKQARAERKAAKKAAAAERAAERKKLAEEKAAARAAEKERLALEKAAEKERERAAKAERERIAKEKAAEEKAAKEKEAREKAEREKERLEKERVDKARKEQEAAAKAAKQPDMPKVKSGTPAASTPPTPSSKAAARKTTKPTPAAPPAAPEPEVQAPILARMPKKNKPIAKPIKIPKEDHSDTRSNIASAATSDAPQLPDPASVETGSSDSRAHSVDRTGQTSAQQHEPVGLEEILCDIDMALPWMNLPKHVIFDASKINPAAKMPLEYGPLVHALSALSVGGGSFANNMPSGSIDNAVSSFQQLLETLTQTISDLLRLLPRTTWDDSTSFDGVLRDMLKGDDFLDDGGEEQDKPGKEDEVAALTMALERRARWMEVQLSKLEELHRDINTAAVRAVLSFMDNGWDRRGYIRKQGNSLARFDQLGMVEENGVLRPMTADELEGKLVVAKEAAAFAEAELREAMERVQQARPLAEDEW